MSFKKCPPPPKACRSTLNPSWSPVFKLEQNIVIPTMELNTSSSYYPYDGRLIKHEEIIAPELLVAIQQNHYLVRQIGQIWWDNVESKEEPFAQPQDSFLCRQDHIEYEMRVENPTEDERSTLKHKRIFIKDEKAYFRSIWITIDYGSTYDGNNCWTRYTVAYLKDNVSPYSFKKDCRLSLL